MNADRPHAETGTARGRVALWVGVILLVAGGIAAFLVAGGTRQPVERAAAPAAEIVSIHDPGVIFRNDRGMVVTVPKGLAQQRHPFELPPTIRMTVGQRVEVRNEDEIAHVVLGMVVPPGGSKTMTLDRAGILVYSAGCAAHVSGSGLTTLMVAEPDGQP